MTESVIRQANNIPDSWYAYTSLPTEHGKRHRNLTHELTTVGVGAATYLVSLLAELSFLNLTEAGHLLSLQTCSGKGFGSFTNNTLTITLLERTCDLHPAIATFAIPLALSCGIATLYYYKGTTKKHLGQVIEVPTQKVETLKPPEPLDCAQC